MTPYIYILLVSLLLSFISIFISFFTVRYKTRKQTNRYYKHQDELEYDDYIINRNERENELNNLILKINEAEDKIKYLDEHYQDKIKDNKKIISEHLEKIKHNASESSDNYFKVLENNYIKQEKEFDDKINKLNSKYKEAESSLEDIKNTLRAATEARIRQDLIDNEESFYCLSIDQKDISDISILNSIENKLYNPRILRMLIWQTYYQKPLKTLSNKILGSSTVSGIYKITNVITKHCYIGQSCDIAKRWSEHAKCGLGIDTPQGNKLYQAMKEYGLSNFSFELLESCPKEELNKKEAFYINLYDSCNFGYNSTIGVK